MNVSFSDLARLCQYISCLFGDVAHVYTPIGVHTFFLGHPVLKISKYSVTLVKGQFKVKVKLNVKRTSTSFPLSTPTSIKVQLKSVYEIICRVRSQSVMGRDGTTRKYNVPSVNDHGTLNNGPL